MKIEIGSYEAKTKLPELLRQRSAITIMAGFVACGNVLTKMGSVALAILPPLRHPLDSLTLHRTEKAIGVSTYPVLRNVLHCSR